MSNINGIIAIITFDVLTLLLLLLLIYYLIKNIKYEHQQ